MKKSYEKNQILIGETIKNGKPVIKIEEKINNTHINYNDNSKKIYIHSKRHHL